MNKYKLNVPRDVDTDEPGSYILNLPRGFRFDERTSCGRAHRSDPLHVQKLHSLELTRNPAG